MNDKVHNQPQLEGALAMLQSTSDGLREQIALVENRIKETFTSAADKEIAYAELWIRRVRAIVEELNKKLGHIKDLNAKRALHLMMDRQDDTIYAFEHSF